MEPRLKAYHFNLCGTLHISCHIYVHK